MAFITGRRRATVDRLFAPLALPVGRALRAGASAEGGGEVDIANEPETWLRWRKRCRTNSARPRASISSARAGAGDPYARARRRPACRRRPPRGARRLPAGYRIVRQCRAGIPAGRSAEERRDPALHGDRRIPRRLPVFIGDDVSDESGFEYVNACGGVSIRVRPAGPTSRATRWPTSLPSARCSRRCCRTKKRQRRRARRDMLQA